MGLDFLFLWIWLGHYLDKAYFLTGIGKYKLLSETTHRAKPLRIGTRLQRLKHPKIRQIKDKNLGLQHNDTPINLNPDSLDLRLTARLHYTFQYGYNKAQKLQSSQIMSLFLGYRGVLPPPTRANILVRWTIYTMPIPAPNSRLIYSVI